MGKEAGETSSLKQVIERLVAENSKLQHSNDVQKAQIKVLQKQVPDRQVRQYASSVDFQVKLRQEQMKTQGRKHREEVKRMLNTISDMRREITSYENKVKMQQVENRELVSANVKLASKVQSLASCQISLKNNQQKRPFLSVDLREKSVLEQMKSKFQKAQEEISQLKISLKNESF